MVNVGDKISISKKRDGGYVGIASGTPAIGNKIGNNEFGWKSGNPSSGDKIVINKDKHGRYMGWKSGSVDYTGCVDKSCPAINNISGSWQVCPSYSYYVGTSHGHDVYGYYGYPRDSDHLITLDSKELSKYTQEINIDCSLNGRYDYWLSSSGSSLNYISCDDDFSLYVNDIRVLRKAVGGAIAPNTYFRINSFLTEGSNTIKMFFKDWWGTSFSYSGMYIIEIDKQEEPKYCSTLLVDSQSTPSPYKYDYWGPTVTIKYPSSHPRAYISASPYTTTPIQCISGLPDNIGFYDAHVDVFINGELKVSFYTNSNIDISAYLNTGDNQIMLHYNTNIYYTIQYISQAYLQLVCII